MACSSLSSASAPASGTSGSERKAWKMLGHAGWQFMLCKGPTQSLQFVHCLVTARWRIVAVSGGLEIPPLHHCNWKVQSDSDGAARSSPSSRKKKVCKHQAYAKRCILHALRHTTHSLIIAGTPTDQTDQLHMPICSSVAPNGQDFAENRSHLEKSVYCWRKEI